MSVRELAEEIATEIYYDGETPHPSVDKRTPATNDVIRVEAERWECRIREAVAAEYDHLEAKERLKVKIIAAAVEQERIERGPMDEGEMQ